MNSNTPAISFMFILFGLVLVLVMLFVGVGGHHPLDQWYEYKGLHTISTDKLQWLKDNYGAHGAVDVIQVSGDNSLVLLDIYTQDKMILDMQGKEFENDYIKTFIYVFVGVGILTIVIASIVFGLSVRKRGC